MKKTLAKKTAAFCGLLTSGELEYICEAHNGLSAKIVEEAGFKGIWGSGLTISAQYGVRDNNETSWTQVLETLEIDFIDESEVLTPADEHNHIWKNDFKAPFVCGCRNLGEALRRIAEGAAMIRTKGEAGSGNIVEAVRHMRTVMTEI